MQAMTVHQPQPITHSTSQVPGAAQHAGASAATLVDMWLRTMRRSVHTGPAYARDISQFMQWRAEHENALADADREIAFTSPVAIDITVMYRGKQQVITAVVDVCNLPLATISRPDLEAYAEHLAGLGLAATTQQRRLNAVRSLLSFCHDIGAIPFNVGARLAMPDAEDKLSERILSKEEVHAMFAKTSKPRDRLILRILYYTGARVEELASLTWRNVNKAENGNGLVTLFGKRNKTRVVPIPAKVAKDLLATRGEAALDAPVFVSQKGGALDTSQVWRIVSEAAKRAEIIDKNVSPHWLRHAHASHALDKGAPATLVRDTLGHSSLAITSRYAHARPSESSAYYLE